MAVWTKCLITDIGRNLIATCQANARTLYVTNCVSSSHDYHNDTIEDLTSLLDIEQTVQVNDKTVENLTTVKLMANFDNSTLATGYDFYTYGIYANDGVGSDVLLLVGVTDAPDSVPAISTAPWQAIINTHIAIANIPNVEVQVNPAANATQEYVQNYVKDKLESITTITIPADDTTNYTTLTDKDGVDFYNIRIPVAGMNADYVGTQPLTPKMIDPSDATNFSIAEWEEVRDTYFPMIMSAWGRAGGYVDVYLYELPDKDFQVQLYGV